MMLAVLSFVAKILFASSLILFFVSAYQYNKIVSEWSDDNPQLDWYTRGRLSRLVIFSPATSEKGRRRRRILAMSTVGFFALGFAAVALQRIADGKGLFE